MLPLTPQEAPMTRSSQSARTLSPIHSRLQKNLNAYALGATAAGVSFLAATPPASAEIVFTPADQKIANHAALNLDLNHDGMIDFKLMNFLHLSTTPFGEALSIAPTIQANGFVGGSPKRFYYFAAALPTGASVGPSRPFLDRKANMAFASLTAFTYVSGGPWKHAINRFLGLKFLINGEIHYGWARLTVLADKKREEVSATLTGYAYETVANQPIKTGQTKGTAEDTSNAVSQSPEPQLGLLALGSPGLSAWRRDP
jgi:hypothetical protein